MSRYQAIIDEAYSNIVTDNMRVIDKLALRKDLEFWFAPRRYFEKPWANRRQLRKRLARHGNVSGTREAR